jgi:hypothetical protein
MKRILFTDSEGGVSIIIPSGSVEVAMKDIPEGVAYEVVDVADIPSDRSFRDAWEHDTTTAPQKILTSINKAKEITKDRLRIERKPLLETQDILFMKAQEAGTSTTDIVTEKNRLRDVTKLADSATTTDELKALEVS